MLSRFLDRMDEPATPMSYYDAGCSGIRSLSANNQEVLARESLYHSRWVGRA